MAYELKEGFGNSFVNRFKKKDNQPDFDGDGMYKGEVIKLVLWKKKTSKGETFLGWAISPKEVKEQPKDYPSGDFKNLDDDIPF